MTPLEERLGYRFSDPGLLTQALTHPSAIKEGRSAGPDYQRLEFLGDSVLQLGVSLLLFRTHPEAREGSLSFLRQELVRRESLARMARRLELRGELVLGESMDSAGETGEDSVLADAMEAVLGAVYLDGGPGEAFRLLEALIEELPELGADMKGNKSALQEWLQRGFAGEVPAYEVREDTEALEEKRFVARVFHRERLLGEGRGRSKKRAEEAAAGAALEPLRSNGNTGETTP
jgi:ribonuclease III